VDLKVEGCRATADFAATTCLTLMPTGQSPPSSLPDNTSVWRREEDESVTQVASVAGDTSADNEAGGHGETLAPNPYVLRNAEGPLDRDELVAIDAWWLAVNSSGGRSDLSVG
jgi:hypothetical protein